MKNNSKELQHNIYINKNKYMLIGFILGLIPFSLLLGILSIYQGGIEFIPRLFKNTLIIFGIIVSLSNGVLLRTMFVNKIKEFQ